MRKNRLGTFLEKNHFRPKNQKISPGHLHPLDHGLEHHGLEAPSQRIFLRKTVSLLGAVSRRPEKWKTSKETQPDPFIAVYAS